MNTMVKVRLREGRYSSYLRRDGSIGIVSPLGVPATNLEVLGLEYSEDSDKPYWTRGANALTIVERHIAHLNEGNV